MHGGDDEEAREWFRRLEEGDEEARRLWETFREVSLREFDEVFSVLGITFDLVAGESHFATLADDAIRKVEEAGLAVVSDGALVVEAIITGVSAADAKAIKERIDGSDLTTPIPALNQPATLGKVKYPAIPAGSTGDLLIYLAHR